MCMGTLKGVSGGCWGLMDREGFSQMENGECERKGDPGSRNQEPEARATLAHFTRAHGEAQLSHRAGVDAS